MFGESRFGLPKHYKIYTRALSAMTLALVLSGCLQPEETGSAESGAVPDSGSTGNSAPTISGTPPVSVKVGDPYSFTPSASDPDGDTLTFRVANLPAWASFSNTTGTLSGVPTLGTVGMHSAIQISVSDGKVQTSLPQFGVEVLGNQTASGMAVVGEQPSSNLPADIGTVIRVTFSSDVDPATVTAGSVTVTDGSGTISGSTSVSGDTVVFTPSSQLQQGTPYNVQVASWISNVAGDSMGAPHLWTFTTSFGDAVPELAAFEDAIFNQGHRWGTYMDPAGPNSQSDKFFHEFYGTAKTFHGISDYLGVAEPWLTYAKWGNEVFRTYLISTGYATQGYRRFTHGMYGEFVRNNSVLLSELEMLRDIPAFSRVAEGRGQGGGEHRSRETALAVVANIHAERAGSPRQLENGNPRLETFIPWMGSQLYEWRTGDYGTPPAGYQSRFAPFMFAISAHALISYIEWERELGNDPNQYWRTNYPMDYGQGITPGVSGVQWPTIVDALSDVASWAVLQAHHESDVNTSMWVPDSRGYASFLYQDINSASVATDLNLMIAPAYAWLWKETGDRRFRDWADQLFGAGALRSNQSATGSGKHFNQQFFLSFDYLKWRAEGDALWL